VGKPEGKRPMRRSSHRWEDNIRMDPQDIGGRGVWTGLSWLRIGTGLMYNYSSIMPIFTYF
jgi:hypothetical protein